MHPHDTDTIDDVLDRLADAETRLAELSREVEHLQRLATVGTLAAGVVHEINNQLTPALAQAQVARLKPGETPGLLRAVDHCIQGITRASRIADTLMGFASPAEDERGSNGTSPGAAGAPQAANVAHAVKTALTCLGTSPERAAVRIETEVPPSTWASIEPLALQQVLVNLLLNAIKALAETNDPTIQVQATHHIDSHQLIVTVEDNGPGIPAALRRRLFVPFSSAPTPNGASKGTGLGLAVSQRLVQAAGGTIEAGQSEWGGAKFTIRLASIMPATRAKSA